MNEHALWKKLSGLMILGKVLNMIASILTASACTGTTPSPSLVNSADVARTTEMKEGDPGEDSASDAAHPQPPASIEPVTATAAPPQNALTPTLELRSPVAEPTVAITGEVLPAAAKPTRHRLPHLLNLHRQSKALSPSRHASRMSQLPLPLRRPRRLPHKPVRTAQPPPSGVTHTTVPAI